MSETIEYSIYCDESCHLVHDRQPIMALGAIWCPSNQTKKVFKEIREIKRKHNLSQQFEIKWTKVSPAKIGFYLELVDYFFKQDSLHFRALIALNKDRLSHERFNQDYDTWYYKMYFQLLTVILNPNAAYKIFLDVKDTHSIEKVQHLHDVLCNNIYDFSRDIIKIVQTIRSHEVELLQLTDLLLGAVSYVNRDLKTSSAKGQIIERIKELSGYSLRSSTLLKEDKFNLFFWMPQTGE